MTIKKSSIAGLMLLIGAASQPITAVSMNPQSVSFALPSSVPQGTILRINGSTSMASVNQSLKQGFEQQYPGTQVNLSSGGTSAGLQALLDGKADLAAIGRPLTDAEKAQGLVAVPVARDKIAIVVGAKNSLSKSLDINQFAKIFRGEIKNWSQVGGTGAIRMVDRPLANDTRQAFRKYPAFKNAPFKTGATADNLNDESPAAVIQNLGANGISYLLANQVRGQSGVKAVSMHGTTPTNPKYPFSQALFYVYTANSPSPGVQAFLGYTAAKAGQEAIKASGVEAIGAASNSEGNAIDAVSTKAAPLAARPIDTANEKINSAVNSSANAGANKAANNFAGSKAASLNAPASSSTTNPNGKTALQPSGAARAVESEEGMPSWWWLLPLASLAALLWMLGKERSRPSPQAYNSPPTGDNGASLPRGYAPHSSQQDFDGTRSNSSLNPTAVIEEGAIAGGEDVAAQSYLEGDRDTRGESALAAGPAIAGGAGAAAWSFLSSNQASDHQAQLDSSRPNAQTKPAAPSNELDNLPKVETEGQISILPRSAEWANIRWTVPRSLRADVPRQGGERLVVRLYDVTGLDLATQTLDRFQQFDCDDSAVSCNVPIPASDRTYIAEIGYLSADDRWTQFARSTPVWIPATNRMG
ncbi:MAG: substrate-binding domain-containing protein [Phormidesmis sp. CAN_BIN36]|nr:substrate-binding domain-containing protein [Phormidesmis sp. CAN_BIN36]